MILQRKLVRWTIKTILQRISGRKRYYSGPTCIFQEKQYLAYRDGSQKDHSHHRFLLTSSLLLITLASSIDLTRGRSFSYSMIMVAALNYCYWIIPLTSYMSGLWILVFLIEHYCGKLATVANKTQHAIFKRRKNLLAKNKEVILVNTAWSKSFTRPITNKHAIDDHGWYPLNRVLLLNNTLHLTMADKDKIQEN